MITFIKLTKSDGQELWWNAHNIESIRGINESERDDFDDGENAVVTFVNEPDLSMPVKETVEQILAVLKTA